MNRYAICIGLTHVNPESHGGWDGSCPGCDRDAARFATMLHDKDFDGIEVRINAAASIQGIKESFVRAAKQLTADDLLVLYVSGHGGQIDDFDEDEEDGKDETLILWDGEANDDQIGAYLRTLPKGVRVWWISDTCNSGKNYRGMKRKRSTPVVISEVKPKGFRGSLLHFGGCADGRYSYGTEQGGAFTIALLDALAKARRPLNYLELFQRASERMPGYQRASVGQWGGPAWSDREVGY